MPSRVRERLEELTGAESKFDLWPSLRLYERLGVPYMVVALPTSSWSGPLWSGAEMMLDATDSYGDVGFFHELAHWQVASRAQRKLPDLGLGRQVNADVVVFASPAAESVMVGWDPPASDGVRNPGWGEATVLISTAHAQEVAAINAMAVYDPLVGLCSWDDPLDSEPVSYMAWSDFGGDADVSPETNRYPARVKRAVFNKFVAKWAPGVTFEEMSGYMDRFTEADW